MGPGGRTSQAGSGREFETRGQVKPGDETALEGQGLEGLEGLEGLMLQSRPNRGMQCTVNRRAPVIPGPPPGHATSSEGRV